MKRCGIVVATALLVLITGVGEVRAQYVADLSGEELQRLEQGRLVMHRQNRSIKGVRLFGGTSWQRVDLPPAVVWQAVLDTSRYPDMLPQVTEAQLVREDPETRLLFLRHGDGLVSARYHLVMQCRARSKIATFYVDPHHPGSLSHGRGYIVVQPFQETSSLITFHILADVSGGMVASVLRPQIQEWMLRVPQTIKRYVEGPGRERYTQLAQR